MIVAMLEGRDPGPTTFSIANGVKDLRTMIATGEARGADMLADQGRARRLRGRHQARLRRRRRLAHVGLLGATARNPVNHSEGADHVCHARSSLHHRRCRAEERRANSSRCRRPWSCSMPAAMWSAFKREDGSGILRFEIAVGKAYGALGMGFGSRTMIERAAQNPNFFTAHRGGERRAAGAQSGRRADPGRRRRRSSAPSAFPATPATTTRSSRSPASRRRG